MTYAPYEPARRSPAAAPGTRPTSSAYLTMQRQVGMHAMGTRPAVQRNQDADVHPALAHPAVFAAGFAAGALVGMLTNLGLAWIVQRLVALLTSWQIAVPAGVTIAALVALVAGGVVAGCGERLSGFQAEHGRPPTMSEGAGLCVAGTLDIFEAAHLYEAVRGRAIHALSRMEPFSAGFTLGLAVLALTPFLLLSKAVRNSVLKLGRTAARALFGAEVPKPDVNPGAPHEPHATPEKPEPDAPPAPHRPGQQETVDQQVRKEAWRTRSQDRVYTGSHPMLDALRGQLTSIVDTFPLARVGLALIEAGRVLPCTKEAVDSVSRNLWAVVANALDHSFAMFAPGSNGRFFLLVKPTAEPAGATTSLLHEIAHFVQDQAGLLVGANRLTGFMAEFEAHVIDHYGLRALEKAGHETGSARMDLAFTGRSPWLSELGPYIQRMYQKLHPERAADYAMPPGFDSEAEAAKVLDRFARLVTAHIL